MILFSKSDNAILWSAFILSVLKEELCKDSEEGGLIYFKVVEIKHLNE